jgi:hypothetical protein
MFSGQWGHSKPWKGKTGVTKEGDLGSYMHMVLGFPCSLWMHTETASGQLERSMEAQ